MSDISNLLRSIAFAAQRHRNQRRKDADASPYINHPIALATLLATTAGVDELVVLQAAVLHDTIEDTETTYQELLDCFGEAVANVVAEVTDDKRLLPQQRKQRQVEHAPHASREAALVKLADKICNLRDMASTPPTDWPLQRRREYFDWAKRVIDGLPSVSRELSLAFDSAYALKP